MNRQDYKYTGIIIDNETNTAGQELINNHIKQGQETNKMWTQEAGTHDTQDRGLTLLPPPGRRVPRHNSSTGGALWRPLRTDMDRNTGRGPPERNRQQRPWRSWKLWRPWRCRELRRPWRCRELRRPWQCRELRRTRRCRELRRPWQVVLVAVASVPSARPLQLEPFLPPQKNFPGEVRGYQDPSGAGQTEQYMTGQDRKALRGQTDRTRQPTGTGSPPGRARKLRLLLAMTSHQGPSQGFLSYLFHFHDRWLEMASAATTRRAACPRQVSVDKTDKMIKMFLWAQQDKIPGRDVWAGSTGLGSAAAGGLESAAIKTKQKTFKNE